MSEEMKTEERMVESEKLEHSRYLSSLNTSILILAMILIAIWSNSLIIGKYITLFSSILIIVFMGFLFRKLNQKAKQKEKNIRTLRGITKEEIEKEISFREFFSNPETGEPNFIVAVGNTYCDYIESVKEFVEIISEEFFSYKEIIPQYAKTQHLGRIKMKKEIKHYVEVDPMSIIFKDDEITRQIKIGYNLLLIGLPFKTVGEMKMLQTENELISELIENGKSQINWEFSDGDYEYIPDAFVEGKAAIICSGENAEAIPRAIKKLAERLGKEHL